MRRALCVLLAVMLSGLISCAVPEAAIGTVIPEEQIAYTVKHRDSGDFMMAGDTAPMTAIAPTQERLWLFFAAIDGTFLMQNEATGAYLSIKDGALCMVSEKSLARGWCLERMRDGSCRIATSDGTYLGIRQGNIVLGSADDRWELDALTLHVNVFYDDAFVRAYDAQGIYVVDALERIVAENTTGNAMYCSPAEFFKNVLHIRLSLHMTDKPCESYPYTAGCLYRDDPTTPCNNCSGAVIDGYDAIAYCQNGYHHKDADHLLQSTPSSNEAFQVLFTGHEATCACDGESQKMVHTDDKSRTFGRSEGIGDGNRCAVFLGAFTDVTGFDRIKFTMVHEISHLLGAQHHRLSEEPCIQSVISSMGDPLINIEADRLKLPLCEMCISLIDEKKAERLALHADDAGS